MITISNKIKKLREQSGISQEEVADSLNMSRPTYASIEAGKREMTISEASRLAQVFSISFEELLYDSSTIATNDFGYEKYKQIVLNALKFGGAETDGRITKTKLAKLAYLADFAWYYYNLKPMSGLPYRRDALGPVPDTYFRAIEDLYASGQINVLCRGTAFMIEPVEEPSASELSKDELALIKEVATKWKPKNTDDIVRFTHEQLPWKICRPGEIIPYELITQEDPGHVY